MLRPFDVARLAGVRLRRERRVAAGVGEPLDGLEHRRRADAAVDADDVRAAREQRRAELLRRRAIEAVAVFFGRDLRHDRQIADSAHGVDRRRRFVPVAERLEHQQVHAAFDERRRLLAEELARFVEPGLAPGLDAHAERPDGAGHIRRVTRGRPRQPGAGQVDGMHLVAQAEGTQLQSRGAKRVGLDDIGAGRQVLAVYLAHEVGLRGVERLEAAVDEHTPAVQLGAHRAVADEHTRGEGVEKTRT